MYAFILNETIHSRRDLGLRITEPPVLPSARRVVDSIQVEGREGTLTLQKGWEDIAFDFRAGIFGSHPEETYRELLPVIHGAKTIYFSSDSSVYYRIKFAETGGLTRLMPSLCDFPLSFVCDPFRYLWGVADLTLTASGAVSNPGTVYARPKITVYGTGNQTLTVNGEQTRLNILSGHLVLDSELLECYRGNVAQNNQMQGPFPRLEPGNNTITLSSGMTKIEIEPRWRYL